MCAQATSARVRPLLSTEASRDNTGLEFSSAFSVNSKVLACAR